MSFFVERRTMTESPFFSKTRSEILAAEKVIIWSDNIRKRSEKNEPKINNRYLCLSEKWNAPFRINSQAHRSIIFYFFQKHQNVRVVERNELINRSYQPCTIFL